jgi:hypothetical protein
VAFSYGALSVVVNAQTAGAARQIRTELTKAGEDASRNISRGLAGGFKGVASALKPVATTAANVLGGAVIATAGFGVAAFKTAARVGEMDASLRALAKANKLSYPQMQATVGAIRRQGIEAGVAQDVVAQFARNNLRLADASKLARVAQDAAVISGRNSSEVTADLIHGITTQNSLVLRNAGVNVQAGQAIAQYAKEQGKSVAQLTNAERSQAVLNAVMASGKNVAGAYAAAMAEPGKVLRSFPRLIDDIRLSVGQGLVQAFGPLILKSYELTKAIAGALAPGGKLAPLLAAIGQAATRLVAPLTRLVERITAWVKALQPSQVNAMTQAVKRFGPAIFAAAGGLAAFAGKNVVSQIPVVGKALSGLAPVAGQLKTAFMGLPTPLKFVVAGFALLMAVSPEFRSAVMDLVGVLLDALKPVLTVIGEVVRELAPVLRDVAKAAGAVLAGAIRASLIPVVKVLAGVLQVIAPIIKPLTYGFIAWKVATVAYTIAQWAANSALLAFPGTWIVLAIAAVVAAVVLAYKHFGWFRNAVNWVVTALRAAGQFITSYVWPVIKVMIALYLLPWIAAVMAVRAAWNALRGPVMAVIAAISGALTAAWNGIWKVVLAAFQASVRLLGQVWRTVFNAWIAPAMRGIGSVVSTVWRATIAPAFNAIRAGARMVGDAFTAMQRVIGRAMSTVVGAVRGPLRSAAFQVINPFLRGANALLGKIGLKIPLIPSFSTGGRIPGYGGGDILPAMLEPGEAVVPKHLAASAGFRAWAKSHRIPGFAEGGLVGNPMLRWGPVDWLGGAFRSVGGGFTKLLRMAKDDVVDPFFKLITTAAFEVFKKGAGPLKKPLEAMARARVPPLFFTQVAGKLGLKMFDGLMKFIESKVAPEFEGGPGVAALAAEVMKKFPALRVTSAMRPGDPGYHGKGWARDLGGPVGVMNAAGRWMSQTMTKMLLEGIHNPTLSVKNYKTVPSGFWGGEWPAHADHIHMAAPPGGQGASFNIGPGSLRSIVDQVAKGFGVPWATNLAMQRINVESGFNARAVNNWDINAQRGYPSTGLAQIIRPTFQQYCGRWCRTGPFLNGVSIDPRAQVYTMFAYSIARYGKNGLAGAWGGRQGYAQGGILAEPVLGIGLRSGTPYTFGERGPELISPLTGPDAWSPERRQQITIHVHPQRGQSETEIAAAVSRRLAWAQQTGRA